MAKITHSTVWVVPAVLYACGMLFFLFPGTLVADVLSSKALLADALAAAGGIDDGCQKAIAMLSIAKAQAETGDVAEAKRTANGIPVNGNDADMQGENGWKNEAYAVIAGEQAKAGDTSGAEATAQGINDADAKDHAYVYITQSLAQKGDISAATAAAAHTSGIDKARADAAIAVAMASVGDTAGAKALVAGFSDADSEQVFAFVKIAEIQFKGGDTPGARQTIELANAATANVDEYLLSACLCAIAKAQVKMGDLAAAKALGKNNTEHLIREIAIAQAEMGDLEAARVSLTQISDADEKVCVEASIAEAQVKSGDTSSAGQTLDEAKWTAAKITESKEDACGRIAAAETKAGDAATAVEWARSQQDPMVKVSALVNIARALHSPSLANGW